MRARHRGAVWSVEVLMDVSASIEAMMASADALQARLERLDRGDPDQLAWTAWQAEMTSHWADVVARDHPRYPALATGLAEFARDVRQALSLGPGE